MSWQVQTSLRISKIALALSRWMEENKVWLNMQQTFNDRSTLIQIFDISKIKVGKNLQVYRLNAIMIHFKYLQSKLII